MKTYQNYLFDLYGTLVDIHTDEDKDALWQKISALLETEGVGFAPEKLKERYFSQVAALETQARLQRGVGAEIDIGPVFASFLAEAGREGDIEAVARLAKAFRLFSLEKLRLFPGAAEMLTRLRQQGKGVYLLSNAQELFTMPELEKLDLLQYFDGIVISSMEGFKKPDRRLYRIALERFSLKAEATVMVGNDDKADCWGAHNVGLDSMYVFTEQSPERTEALPPNCHLLQDISQVI